MIKIKRNIALFLAMLAVTASSCGLFKEEEKIDSNNLPNLTDSVLTENSNGENNSTNQGNVNNLTGENTLSDSAKGKRPVAVMVNNITASLPQYGVSSADIIIEAPVEAGITRLMAIYGDYTKVPNVCSIRSCRYYYPIFALGYDAIYAHWGEDKTVAAETLDRLNVDTLDGDELTNIFARDTQRQQSYSNEHTGYLVGSLIPRTLESLSIRTDLSSDKNVSAFNFSETTIKPSETACTTATINFSSSYYSTFTFDEATKTYAKQHNGSAHIDAVSGEQLTFTNVFYLETTTSVINDKNGLISLDWQGGDGYYISNGAIIEIKWSKNSETAPFEFTNLDGTPLTINTGKSYIGFANANALYYN